MPEGKFIVFEGIDGSGTTVQVEILRKALVEEGIQCHKTAEPSQGAIGKLIRKIIGGKTYTYLNRMDPERLKVVLALLFTADRADHVWTEMETKWADGDVILCDRYAISTLCYELGVLTDREWLTTLGRALLVPDLTLYLRLSADQAFGRLKKRWEEKGEGGAHPEIFEKVELQRKLVSHYDAFCGQLYEGERIARTHNVITIDASGSIEEVAKLVYDEVETHLQQWGLTS